LFNTNYDPPAEAEDDGRIRITVIGEGPAKIDLSAFTTEGMLATTLAAGDQIKDAARKKGVPAKHYDPKWKPKRRKGDPLDRDGVEHQSRVAAVIAGLPAFSSLSWLECQLFDNGPANGRHAHTRFRLKLTGTSAAPGALIGVDKRAVSRTFYASLSSPKQFRANCLRKKDKHALSSEDWQIIDVMKVALGQLPAREDRPESLMGHLSVKLHGEGTLRVPGQFATLTWDDAGGIGWQPQMTLFQFFRHQDGQTDVGEVLLAPPPQIKPGRKATACAWYGRHESDAFRSLMSQGQNPSAAILPQVQAWKAKRDGRAPA
jgi:hypothetical protein